MNMDAFLVAILAGIVGTIITIFVFNFIRSIFVIRELQKDALTIFDDLYSILKDHRNTNEEEYETELSLQGFFKDKNNIIIRLVSDINPYTNRQYSLINKKLISMRELFDWLQLKFYLTTEEDEERRIAHWSNNIYKFHTKYNEISSSQFKEIDPSYLS